MGYIVGYVYIYIHIHVTNKIINYIDMCHGEVTTGTGKKSWSSHSRSVVDPAALELGWLVESLDVYTRYQYG